MIKRKDGYRITKKQVPGWKAFIPNMNRITAPVEEITIIHRKRTRIQKTIPHILVVDDNEELRDFLKESLSAHYHITEATDGQKDYQKQEKSSPI